MYVVYVYLVLELHMRTNFNLAGMPAGLVLKASEKVPSHTRTSGNTSPPSKITSHTPAPEGTAGDTSCCSIAQVASPTSRSTAAAPNTPADPAAPAPVNADATASASMADAPGAASSASPEPPRDGIFTCINAPPLPSLWTAPHPDARQAHGTPNWFHVRSLLPTGSGTGCSAAHARALAAAGDSPATQEHARLPPTYRIDFVTPDDAGGAHESDGASAESLRPFEAPGGLNVHASATAVRAAVWEAAQRAEPGKHYGEGAGDDANNEYVIECALGGPDSGAG